MHLNAVSTASVLFHYAIKSRMSSDYVTRGDPINVGHVIQSGNIESFVYDVAIKTLT